jgi:hypothetical protein
MTDRVRLALDLAPAGTIPPRFEAAYRRGGTPTSLHLALLADAAGTTPAWIMTGRPEHRAPERNAVMPDQPDDQQHAAQPRPSADDLLARARLDHTRDVPAEPPHNADTYQTGRSYTAAEISRRVKSRRRLEPTGDARRLAEQLLAEVIQQETDRATGGDDLDAYQEVRHLAEQYEYARGDAEGLDYFLDRLADALDLADIRALRLAGEAAVAATPRAIKAAKGRGMTPPRIAAELGLTPSRVYQVLRELDAAETTPDDAAPWDAFWTVERHEGGEWHELTAQSRNNTKERPDALARYLLSGEQSHHPEGARLRVRVWKFGTSDTAAPLAEAETAPPADDARKWARDYTRRHNRGDRDQ